MKRVIILFLILLLPVVLANTPPMPAFTEDGVEYTEEVTSVTQIGGVPYVETYTKENHCPVIFEKDTTGIRKPFYAQIDSTTGYFKSSQLSPKDIKSTDIQQQGITCGRENLKLIRPTNPPPPGIWKYKIDNTKRQLANADLGIGVRTQKDGTIDYINPKIKEAILNGEIKPPRLSLPEPTIIMTGNAVYNIETEQKEVGTIIIPIDFPDQKASKSISQINDKFLESDGFANYLEEQSYGNLRIAGDVAPQWYTMSQNMDYYGDNYEGNIEEMITEAIRAADADIDFSQYDYNQDGIVDSIFIVHAGAPDEVNGGGNGPEIWSHYFSITPVTADGVQIIDYETVSEDSSVGIIAHEFGHYLGLPDLYDTDPSDGESKGVGEWSLMGYGGYLDPPGSLDPWSKIYLSWLNTDSYQEVNTDNYFDLVQDNSQTGIRYYGLPISATELFLIENRHQTELMNGDKAEGILIWHIDESVIDETGSWSGCRGTRWDCNTVNSDSTHKLVNLEEADGKNDLDNNNLGDTTDPWYNQCSTFSGCQQNIFDASSTPSGVSYDYSQSVYVGVYSAPSEDANLGLSSSGTVLQAPALDETTTAEQIDTTTNEQITNNTTTSSSSNTLLFIIIGVVLILIIGGVILYFKLKK